MSDSANLLIAMAMQLAERYQAETFSSKNFEPIDLRGNEQNSEEEYGSGALDRAINAVATWLGDFELGGVRPFWSVSMEMFRLKSDVPTSPESLARSDWSDRLSHLIQQVEEESNNERLGGGASFDALRESIVELRTVLKRSKEQWTTDNELAGETAVIFIVGNQQDIDCYVQALGKKIRVVRGKNDEPTDNIVVDPPEQISVPLEFQDEVGKEGCHGTLRLNLLGSWRSPIVVELCAPHPLTDLESLPRLKKLFEALICITGGLQNVPGQPYEDLLIAISGLAVDGDLAEILRKYGPALAVQMRTVALKLGDSSMNLPDLSKGLLGHALEVAAEELSKCENIPEPLSRNNVAFRLVTVSALGPRTLVNRRLMEAITIDESRFQRPAKEEAESELPDEKDKSATS